MAEDIVKSIGHHGLWGYSSAFDAQEAWLNSHTRSASSTATAAGSRQEEDEDDLMKPLNILLVNPGDVRHIITTISRRRRHAHNTRENSNNNNTGEAQTLRPLHFYLLESSAEVLARDILLLEVLNDYEVPIRQRATVFLEIFGNFQVQDRTARYIEQLGHQLRSLVCDSTGRLEDLVDLSMLKYRDRDSLEMAFKSYARSFPYDAASLRDHRLRGLYAERYDRCTHTHTNTHTHRLQLHVRQAILAFKRTK
jgi:dynein assembly factor 3